MKIINVLNLFIFELEHKWQQLMERDGKSPTLGLLGFISVSVLISLTIW